MLQSHKLLSPSIEVERRSRLAFEEFEARYLIPRQPVVISDALEEWLAMRKWTPEFFKKRYGGRLVHCRNGGRDPVRLSDYIDSLCESTDQQPAPYLRNLDLKGEWEELCADIQPRLPFASPDWLSSRLMPANWLRPNGLHQLFISGAGATISLHFDDWMSHNFVSNLHGEKEFTFFPPEAGEFLYPKPGDRLISQVNIHGSDLEEFPLAKLAPFARLTIGPGDSLFVPAGWWHTSRTVTTCISVSSSFANWSNWSLLIDDCMANRRNSRNARRVSDVLVWGYLSAVGAVLAGARRIGLPHI